VELDQDIVVASPGSSHNSDAQPVSLAQDSEPIVANAIAMLAEASQERAAAATLEEALRRVRSAGSRDTPGANLRGAGFTGSDLSGAIFRGADLTNSVMDDLSGGGTLGADFTKATMGWNQLVGGPLVNLTAVFFDESCTDRDLDGHMAMTLSGLLLGAKFAGLDLDHVFLVARDFRLADLTGAQMAGYGTLPRGLDFKGANLTGENLNAMNIANSFFDGTDMMNADFSGSESHDNSYVQATIVGTDFSRSTLSWNDFTSATFEAVLHDQTIVVAVICEDNQGTETVSDSNAVRYYGLCTSDWVVIF
jgi:uncharacterized protein YjbI with pentapeptide repeats